MQCRQIYWKTIFLYKIFEGIKVKVKNKRALEKVSDRNSFRANENNSDSFRYLYPSRCESFRTNPKNVLHLVWWKTVKNRSDLVRFSPRQLSEWIGNQVFDSKQSFHSVSIRARIDPFFIKRDIKRFSDWFGMIRIGSDANIGMNRNSSDWFGINSYPILSPGSL